MRTEGVSINTLPIFFFFFASEKMTAVENFLQLRQRPQATELDMSIAYAEERVLPQLQRCWKKIKYHHIVIKYVDGMKRKFLYQWWCCSSFVTVTSLVD